jgi:hypothetical protein
LDALESVCLLYLDIYHPYQATLPGKIVKGYKKEFGSKVYRVHYARGGEKIIGSGSGRVIMPGLDHACVADRDKAVSGEIDDNILFDSLWNEGAYTVQFPSPIVDYGSPFNYSYTHPD